MSVSNKQILDAIEKLSDSVASIDSRVDRLEGLSNRTGPVETDTDNRTEPVGLEDLLNVESKEGDWDDVETKQIGNSTYVRSFRDRNGTKETVTTIYVDNYLPNLIAPQWDSLVRTLRL